MRIKVIIHLFFFILVACNAIVAQDSTIVFKGKIFDKKDTSAHPVPIIINKRTGTGESGSADGSFSISGLKSDTFLLASGGYNIVKFCFRDSGYKPVYKLRIGLVMKENVMSTVVIYPVKDLDEINRERQSIVTPKEPDLESVTDAFESPITFLYNKYSREGRSKAMVAMLENEDKKQQILKELFRTYARAGVIDLKEEEYDNFIAYLSIPEYVLKNYSDYDLALYIRNKYIAYRAAQNYHLNNQR